MRRIALAFILLYAGFWCLAQQDSRAAGWLPLVKSGHPLLVGLVSFWGFEDAGSPPTSWVDSTATGNNLTPNGTPNPSSTPGIVGNALNLVGANSQYLSHANNSSLALAGGSYSIQTWVRFPTASPTNNLPWLSKAAGFAVQEYAIQSSFISSGNQFVFSTWASGNQATVTATSFGNLSANTWYHVVSTFNFVLGNFVMTIYVNANGGDQVTTNYGGNTPAQTAAEFDIGTQNAGASGFQDVKIDQVGLWNRVLSTGEISSLYNGGAGLAYGSM